jgi:two-component system, NarL family, response regulator NreC
MTVTILLADDHPIIRLGIKNLLDTEEDLMVVGEAENGKQAVLLAERLKPDILIVDMMMPILNGLEVIRRINQRLPQTRCIVLSLQSATPYVMQALKAGAFGYILKDSGPNEVIHAIHKVMDDQRYLSPQLSEHLINIFIEKTESGPLDPYHALTNRERELLQICAEGQSNKEIAELLSISPRTVEQHRQSMMRKMGFNNQTELIRFALKRGILPMDV